MPRNKAVWGSLAFVAVALVIDGLVARGLDEQTGKSSPAREEAGEPPAGTQLVGPGAEAAASRPESATA